MAKLFIIDNNTNERIPFLRGVLVESLVRTGLSFQDAYLVAQSIRDTLGTNPKVTTSTLEELISQELRDRFGKAVEKRYEQRSVQNRQIIVETSNDELPFSTSTLSRSLRACVINRADAQETAKQIHESLQKAGTTHIHHTELKQVIYEHLLAQGSTSAAERFISWRRFKESGLPLIILAGGITGTGKSTLTTELAYQLNIVRTQSTDMMREIVRCYVPSSEIPTLAYSSFEAWRGLKDVDQYTEPKPEDLIKGFLSQFKIVKKGLEATIHRAVKENHDLLIDGVHVLPSQLNLNIFRDKAVVIPLALVVQKKKTLGKRLKQRARENPERTSSRYLKRLDEIWQLQSYIVSEAETHQIPLVVNNDIDEAFNEILMYISKIIMQRFPSESNHAPA